MREKMFCASALIIVVLLLLGVTPGNAQTVANGPYYATPSWDQTLPSNTRFIVLLNMSQSAVLDRETGLVWEKAAGQVGTSWVGARHACVDKTTGGRKGWRLPSVHELASLIDSSVASPGPTLPAGHPFANVSGVFWSATTNANLTTSAWTVSFTDASIAGGENKFGGSLKFWCVRGGMNAEAY